MAEFTIRLPRPYPLQEAFISSPAKRRVICAGRRAGKTTGLAVLAVRKFLAGHQILEAAPIALQTNTFWRACKKALVAPIKAGAIYKNETDRVLIAPGGGRITARTAHHADSLRGDYADLLILDEYSIMHPSAWDEVGAPMLLDNDGDAVFIFTPKRKNHAYKHFMRAQGDQSGRWQAWQFASMMNPHLSRNALAEIVEDLTEDSYKQEILAQFLENEGAIFRKVDKACRLPAGEWLAHRGHIIVMGVDWGKKSDYTAISIGCATCRCELAKDRFNTIDYAFQTERLWTHFNVWGPTWVVAEANSMGEPLIDFLQRQGMPVVPFYTTSQSKNPMIERLALGIERGEWAFLTDTVWQAELEAYELKRNPVTGYVSYSAPDGVHDDTVIARGLMLYCADHVFEFTMAGAAVVMEEQVEISPY